MPSAMRFVAEISSAQKDPSAPTQRQATGGECAKDSINLIGRRWSAMLARP
jgi:hypothetical protein